MKKNEQRRVFQKKRERTSRMRKQEFYEIMEKDFSMMTKDEVRDNTKNAVSLLSDICNNLFYDFRELVTRLSENEKAKENMEALSAEWVRVLHKQREEHRYDARNEYSVCLTVILYMIDILFEKGDCDRIIRVAFFQQETFPVR